ncbi:MAG: hypothetical protein HEEMFOPI_00042 [Holosporales bacterium]
MYKIFIFMVMALLINRVSASTMLPSDLGDSTVNQGREVSNNHGNSEPYNDQSAEEKQKKLTNLATHVTNMEAVQGSSIRCNNRQMLKTVAAVFLAGSITMHSLAAYYNHLDGEFGRNDIHKANLAGTVFNSIAAVSLGLSSLALSSPVNVGTACIACSYLLYSICWFGALASTAVVMGLEDNNGDSISYNAKLSMGLGTTGIVPFLIFACCAPPSNMRD